MQQNFTITFVFIIYYVQIQNLHQFLNHPKIVAVSSVLPRVRIGRFLFDLCTCKKVVEMIKNIYENAHSCNTNASRLRVKSNNSSKIPHLFNPAHVRVRLRINYSYYLNETQAQQTFDDSLIWFFAINTFVKYTSGMKRRKRTCYMQLSVIGN